MNKPTVSSAGTDSGMKMRHQICRRLAPSINAASSNSAGMPEKNWRSRKMLIAPPPNQAGMINGLKLSSQPILKKST